LVKNQSKLFACLKFSFNLSRSQFPEGAEGQSKFVIYFFKNILQNWRKNSQNLSVKFKDEKLILETENKFDGFFKFLKDFEKVPVDILNSLTDICEHGDKSIFLSFQYLLKLFAITIILLFLFLHFFLKFFTFILFLHYLIVIFFIYKSLFYIFF
jgi:hypothetical protein